MNDRRRVENLNKCQVEVMALLPSLGVAIYNYSFFISYNFSKTNPIMRLIHMYNNAVQLNLPSQRKILPNQHEKPLSGKGQERFHEMSSSKISK